MGRLRSPRWIALAALLGCPLAGGEWAAAAERPQPRIVSPRPLATVLGTTRIEVRIESLGTYVVKWVVIRVDDEILARIESPPWIADWDAGDGASGHSIEALLYLSDGSVERTAIRTSPLRINQREEVDLVTLYPIVLDEQGRYVADLRREDFQVFENGKEQRIERFSTERQPLRIGIVLDASLSMGRGRKLEQAQQAALDFLEVLQPGDMGLVAAFHDEVRVIEDVTEDRERLAEAIRGVEAGGGTALYDAIWRTARRLGSLRGRRVLVLLSDGRDEAANGLEPGSLHSADEALDQALRSEVMLFCIGLGRNLDREIPGRWGPRSATLGTETLAAILRSLADSTGGRAFISSGPGKLRKAFREVAEDLRHQYALAYPPPSDTRPGEWRELRIRVPARRVQVIGKKGYYASANP